MDDNAPRSYRRMTRRRRGLGEREERERGIVSKKGKEVEGAIVEGEDGVATRKGRRWRELP